MIRPEIIHTSNIIRTKQVCVKENEVRGHEFERKQVGGYMEGVVGRKGENDANIFYFRKC